MENENGLVEVGFVQREQTYDLEKWDGVWVTIRRLSHGKSNELSDLRLAFTPGEEEEDKGQARLQSKSSRHFAFKSAIVDHNMAIGGRKLDMSKRRDVDSIDPIVGDEIAQLIDDHQEKLGDNPNSDAS